MDPNETLRRLRQVGEELSRVEGVPAITEAVELFTALDEWLSRGGYPPADWQHTKQ